MQLRALAEKEGSHFDAPRAIAKVMREPKANQLAAERRISPRILQKHYPPDIPREDVEQDIDTLLNYRGKWMRELEERGIKPSEMYAALDRLLTTGLKALDKRRQHSQER